MSEGYRPQLTEEELAALKKALGRELNELELAMADVEWSEHCSYKSSKPLLKQLPTEGERVILGPGFDAGVLDVGEGYVATVHIESHNHPSAIDPYGGAATGVGGILRDILCMGTRPVAILNSLRFGRIDKSAHSRWLFKHVVRGIADYGNCVGVPTVGGEVGFDESFETNCLVDVVCIGVGRREDLVLAVARHEGDSIIIVGGRTGRDGIKGAAFASRVITDRSEADRSAVQIPDPFTKKLIIEATLEALATGKVRGLKDLGGGGLACALSEMAEKGGTGVEVDVALVPRREEGMMPIEVMISESQERMLFIVEEGHEGEVIRIFEKYELPYAIIGKVTADRRFVVKEGGRVLADPPVSVIANAPTIKREVRRPSYMDRLSIKKPSIPEDVSSAILALLSSPNIASKRWVYEQYDHEVGIMTVIKPGQADAAVLRLPNGKLLAIKIDGNPQHSFLDPYHGAAGALAECCRNVLAVGAYPIAMVDHLQFGDPGNPEVFWTFAEAVRGLADYCRHLNLPCVGGKVSFYNEDKSTGQAIKPSPVVSVLGLIDKKEHIKTSAFRDLQKVVVIGTTKDELGGSEYYEYIHQITGGSPPKVDFELEKRLHSAVKALIKEGLVESIHDCSAGGLAVCWAEMCIGGGVGVDIELKEVPSQCSRIDDLIFSESHARFVAGVEEGCLKRLMEVLKSHGLEGRCVGSVKDGSLILRWGGKKLVSIDVDRLREVWEGSIPRIMGEVL